VSNPLLDSPLVQSIGWALIHFIWQGTLIGGGTALALRAMSRHSAATRYVVACCGLGVMLLAPVASVLTTTVAADSVEAVSVVSAAPDLVTAVPIDRILSVAVALWTVGVALLSIRLIAAWIGIEQMRRTTREVDEAVCLRLRALAQRLGVRRTVRVFASNVVRVPAIVGFLRPVILLPVSVITGLPAAHLETVLAHELAHVRRHDYLVNALQAIVETLLFYHPAVWWCSRQIRIEREHCCDDLVVEVCGDRVGYATALAQLEELRGLEPMLSLNATGGRLIDRVRRVLGYAPVNERGSTAWIIVPALTLVVMGIVVAPVLTLADADDGALANQSDITLQEPPPAAPQPPRAPRAPLPPAPQAPARTPAVPAPPAAPAPPAPPALPSPPALPALGTLELPPSPAPPDPPTPPDPPQSPDELSDVARELNRASQELFKSLDEVRRAADEINSKQAELRQAEAELVKMRMATLASNAKIEEFRKAIEQLAAASKFAPLNQLDETQLRKQIDEVMKQIEKLRER
jgi:bla regulator protein blaR1